MSTVAIPSVKADSLERYVPDAGPVAQAYVEQARDWAQQAFEDRGINAPESSTRQGRALVRAIFLYALYLQAAFRGSALRAPSASAAVKSISLGTLKLERAAVNNEAGADGLIVSSDEWLSRAGLALYDAGIPMRGPFAGIAG